MTKEEIQTKITEFKTKHPKYAAIVEEIPNLDLKETVKGYLAAGAVQKMLKFHANFFSGRCILRHIACRRDWETVVSVNNFNEFLFLII